MSTCLRALSAIAALACATLGLAEDAFYHVPLRDLNLSEGVLPQRAEQTSRRYVPYARGIAMLPYAVLDGEGEAYVVNDPRLYPIHAYQWAENGRLAARTAEPRVITGRLFFPKADFAGMEILKFTIPATEAKATARSDFYRAKHLHYESLLTRGIPGSAWFRQQARQAEKAWNPHARRDGALPVESAPGRAGDLGMTFDLFTGGRAISENLQLDGIVLPAGDNASLVKVDLLQGITVREIDWQPLVRDLKPELDPLAAKIPADQHAVFFPSFSAAMTLTDQMGQRGTTLLRLANPRAEDSGMLAWYQHQLGLSVHGVGRLLGRQLIRSVAVTGSDPCLPTGTDVAVLFETPDPEQLMNLFLAQIGLAAADNTQAKWARGDIAGVTYRGVQSPDRCISSYIAKLDGAVVVTNSLYQVGRLASVRKGDVRTLASLPEYTFFRDRYRRSDAGEMTLVFLSDATIRRWCGPRWRIGNSRRTRDAAVMAQMQAQCLERMVKQTATPGPIESDWPLATGGELLLTPDGVVSSTLGSLTFMTPIAELPLDQVTQAEAEAYQQWRTSYETLWRWAFDPISLRLSMQREALSADLTVMPLALATGYREVAMVFQGVQLPAYAGDRHNALAHAMLALDPQSTLAREVNDTLKYGAGNAEFDVLSWLGKSVEFYVDDDPFWQELAKVPDGQQEKFIERESGRIPCALCLEASDRQKLLKFLPALRAFLEKQGLKWRWESRTYKDQPYDYVKASGVPHVFPGELSICLAALDDSLLITLSESVLKRAVDRQMARRGAKAEGKPLTAPGKPWLGSTLCLQVDRKALEIGTGFGDHMQTRSWDALPILNEWNRLSLNEDPVKLHERFWKTHLACPGGGTYVWNDRWQTFASTVYGHPGEPKPGPALPPALSNFKSGNFGLTLENRGLRARVSLECVSDLPP